MAHSALALHNEAARRYAGALFTLAHEADQLDLVEAELSSFAKLVQTHEALAAALKSPVVSLEEKEAVLMDLCKSRKNSDLLRRFLALIARAGRAGELTAFAGAFKASLAKHHGRVGILVRTAQKTDTDERKNIERALASVWGEATEIVYETDPSLIGGLQIRKGSHLIDISLRAGLDGMCRSLKGI